MTLASLRYPRRSATMGTDARLLLMLTTAVPAANLPVRAQHMNEKDPACADAVVTVELANMPRQGERCGRREIERNADPFSGGRGESFD